MAHKTETTTPKPIQVQKFLGGVDYPTEKDSLVKHAKAKGADENVLHALNQMGGSNVSQPE